MDPTLREIIEKFRDYLYNMNVKAVCACGAVFEVGSTMPEIKNEICSQCHPFYTGNEKIMDTAGRVERFNKRRAATVKVKAKK